MPVDPAARQILDLIDEMGFKFTETTPIELRAQMAAMEAMRGAMPDVASVEWRDIEGVPCQIVTPAGTGPFPVMIWIHGGGWVIGSAENSEGTARRLSVGVECVVVNVDYPLAPEAKYPAAPRACIDVARWVKANAANIGGDPAHVAVGGDSAGGNLSAVVANAVPGITYQLLVYPATDFTMSHPSIDENGEGYMLTKDSLIWFSGHYFADDTDPMDPQASPLYASDDVLAAAPPGHVITAEFDPLRDEGEAYAEKLRELGVAVTNTRYEGQIHGFYSMTGMIPAADQAVAESVELLRKAFAS